MDYEQPFAAWLAATLAALTTETGPAPASHGVSAVLSTAGTTAADEEATGWDKDRPFPARLKTNRRLSAETSAKDVRHFEIALGDSGLTYEVVRTASSTCAAGTADTTGTSLITAGTAVTTVAGPNTFSLTKGATVAVPGTTQWLCFKVTADNALVQSQTGTVTWQLTAASV